MPAPARSTSPPPPAITRKYKIERELGAGAYGVVSSAKRIDNGQEIAIKRVTKVFDKTILAKRALREIKLIRHFNGHDNITAILDIEVANINDYGEIFLVQELMEADLHQIIRSDQPLTDAHNQYFVYQILRGLKYIHSANVLHRDLKPGNLLVNADCELKICDFGLARGFTDKADSNGSFMTEYVATRWYRAPEIMLSFQSYTKAIDIWSVGCIFGELLSRKPLFRGRDYVDQLNQILAILGTPDDETIRRIGSQRAQVYIKSLPHSPRVPFSRLMPNATPLALDLLSKLLQFDPSLRITVEQALAHPYLSLYHDPAEEPCHNASLDFSFEDAKSIEDIRKLITGEITSWKTSLAAAEAALIGVAATQGVDILASGSNVGKSGQEQSAEDISGKAQEKVSFAAYQNENQISKRDSLGAGASGTMGIPTTAAEVAAMLGQPVYASSARKKSMISPEILNRARATPKTVKEEEKTASPSIKEANPNADLEKELATGIIAK